MTDAPFEWVDIMAGCVAPDCTQITEWLNNGPDGWFLLDLPFDFRWFGNVETTIWIGTQGVLTFGDDLLPYTDNQPVPCNWDGCDDSC